MRRFQSRVVPVAVAMAALKQRAGASGRFTSSGPSTSGDKGAKPLTPSEAAAGVENVLPGVDLAKRVADPSQAFPASWSADEPLAPNDPRIVWKEHYSLAEEKPYYHNVNTNETTDEIPEGFVTRFPQLYRRAGFTIDERGAVFRSANPSPQNSEGEATSKEGGGDGKPSVAAGKPKKLSGREKLAAYGGGGLLWYLIVHNVCLATIFSLLYFFKVDLVAVARSYGFNVKVKRSEQVEEIAENSRRNPPFFKTFVLAVVLNKLLVPIQLVFTLATAPLLVHRLEPIAVVLLPKCKVFFQSLKQKITGGAP